MQFFWWAVLGLATTWGVLKFFLDVRAVSQARKEGWRLSQALAAQITTSGPEPIEPVSNDASIASAEDRAVLEEDRQAA